MHSRRGPRARARRSDRRAAQDKLKVGFIYVGPIGDMGWSYQHEVGRKAIEEAYKGKIDTTYLENVNEGPDAERSIEQLARAGHKLIFTTSFGFMDATAKVAKKYPNVMFEHATGYKRDKNLATYSGRFYEGRYIQGQIAAKMSKTGTIGYIGSFPIPEVVSGINAIMLGAQSVNPDMKVKIIWVNTWYDPGKEAAAARALPTRAPTSSRSTPTRPRRCSSPTSAASSRSGRTPT